MEIRPTKNKQTNQSPTIQKLLIPDYRTLSSLQQHQDAEYTTASSYLKDDKRIEKWRHKNSKPEKIDYIIRSKSNEKILTKKFNTKAKLRFADSIGEIDKKQLYKIK